MSEFDVDFAEGDEIQCSPIEMLGFISQILANNGEFYIDGKVLVVTKYPVKPEASPVTPKEIEVEEPGHPPIPEPEPEIEFEKTVVVQEPSIPVATYARDIVVKIVEDLSPAEDLADIEVPVPVEEVKPAPAKRGRKPAAAKTEEEVN